MLWIILSFILSSSLFIMLYIRGLSLIKSFLKAGVAACIFSVCGNLLSFGLERGLINDYQWQSTREILPVCKIEDGTFFVLAKTRDIFFETKLPIEKVEVRQYSTGSNTMATYVKNLDPQYLKYRKLFCLVPFKGVNDEIYIITINDSVNVTLSKHFGEHFNEHYLDR